MHQALPCTGGAVTRFAVPNEAKTTQKWQVTFTGRATQTVTLNVRAFKSDVDEALTGVTSANLATVRTITFEGKVDEIVVVDTGNTGDFVAEITSIY